jgi:hypothetical protein
VGSASVGRRVSVEVGAGVEVERTGAAVAVDVGKAGTSVEVGATSPWGSTTMGVEAGAPQLARINTKRPM